MRNSKKRSYHIILSLLGQIQTNLLHTDILYVARFDVLFFKQFLFSVNHFKTRFLCNYVDKGTGIDIQVGGWSE